MGPAGLAGSDQLEDAAAEVSVGEGDQAPIGQLVADEVVGHVAPAEALQNDFLLHHLIAHRAGASAFQHEVVTFCRNSCAIADHALHELAHTLDCCVGGWKWEEAGRRYRDEGDTSERDGLESGLALVDVMKDEINL